jgi:hypothetical protein
LRTLHASWTRIKPCRSSVRISTVALPLRTRSPRHFRESRHRVNTARDPRVTPKSRNENGADRPRDFWLLLDKPIRETGHALQSK